MQGIDSHLYKYAGLGAEEPTDSFDEYHHSEEFEAQQTQEVESEAASPEEPEEMDSAQADIENEAEEGEEPPIVSTKRHLWASPWAKLSLVGGGVLLTVLVLGVTLNGMMTGVDLASGVNEAAPSQKEPEGIAEAEPDISDVPIRAALGSQAQEIKNHEKRAAAANASKADANDASAKSDSGEIASAGSGSVESYSPPAPVDNYSPPSQSYSPPAPVESYAPVDYSSDPEPIVASVPQVIAEARAQREAAAEPEKPQVHSMEDWEEASSIGSYGSATSSQKSEVASTPGTNTEGTEGIAAIAANAVGSEEEADIGYTPALATTDSVDPAVAVAQETIARQRSEPDASSPSARAIPTLAVKVEPQKRVAMIQPGSLAIANEVDKIMSATPMVAMVNAATKARGVLQTAIFQTTSEKGQSESLSSNQMLIQLTSPVKSVDGSVALPSGSQLVAKVDAFSPNGMIAATGTSLILQRRGQLQQVPLPEGAIQITGKRGKPLQASRSGGKGKFLLKDLATFGLGAASKGASLPNRTRSESVVATNGGIVTSSQNPDPDLLAGALEGGTTAMLDQMQQRHEKAYEELESQPNVLVVKQGTDVEVMVVRPFTLPRRAM